VEMDGRERFKQSRNLFDRLANACLVVHMHHADHHSVGPQGTRY
jgi:hypothetical protein